MASKSGSYNNPIAPAAMDRPAGALERQITSPVWDMLLNSVFPDANPQSVLAAWDYCQARRLDILKKPVHIVPMKVNDVWRDVIIPGIYELRATAQRTGQYVGQDAPAFGPIVTVLGIEVPEFCTVTVYRLQHAERQAYSHTAYFAEECALKSGGEINSMWRKRRRGQLAKVAEAGALRKAFPEETGGEMAAEEMQGVVIDGEAEAVADTLANVVGAEDVEGSERAPTVAMGPGDEPFTLFGIMGLIEGARTPEDLSFAADLINQVAEPREKLALGKRLSQAAQTIGQGT